MSANNSIQILVCASGKSTRFASNKLLHVLPDGRSILQTTLEHIRQATQVPCSVIIPAHQTDYVSIITDCECEALLMEPASQGLGETIAYGVKQSADALGWLICLADMPAITPEVYQLLCESAHFKNIVAPSFKGKRGHPVYFPNHFYSQLANLSGDRGAASIIHQHPSALTTLPVNESSVLLDVDMQTDLALLLKSYSP